MSDAIVLPQPGETESKKVPTVYFIDDSATMREVIKIAFVARISMSSPAPMPHLLSGSSRSILLMSSSPT